MGGIPRTQILGLSETGRMFLWLSHEGEVLSCILGKGTKWLFPIAQLWHSLSLCILLSPMRVLRSRMGKSRKKQTTPPKKTEQKKKKRKNDAEPGEHDPESGVSRIPFHLRCVFHTYTFLNLRCLLLSTGTLTDSFISNQYIANLLMNFVTDSTWDSKSFSTSFVSACLVLLHHTNCTNNSKLTKA